MDNIPEFITGSFQSLCNDQPYDQGNLVKKHYNGSLVALIDVDPLIRRSDQAVNQQTNTENQQTNTENQGITDRYITANSTTILYDRLKTSIKNGDMEALSKIISEKPELLNQSMIDNETGKKFTLPGFCTIYNKIDMFNKLLQLPVILHADIQSRNHNNYTTLHIAAKQGNTEIVQKIINLDKNINAKTKDGKNAIHLAAQNGHDETLSVLINASMSLLETDTSERPELSETSEKEKPLKAFKHEDIHAPDKNGNTALHLSARYGHTTCAEILLDNDADINKTNKYGYTPFHEAILNNHIDTVKKFLEKCDQVHMACDQKDDHDSSSLHLAAMKGHPEITKVLIESVTKKNNSHFVYVQGFCELYPFEMATGLGNLATMKIFLENGATLSKGTHAYNTALFPIHFAAQSGNTAAAELVLRYDPDCNKTTSEGWNPLHYTARDNDIEMAKLLLENGASVDSKDLNGSTPLHIAARHGHKDIADLFLKNSADIEAKTQSGLTALDSAIFAHQSGIVETFIEEYNEGIYSTINSNNKTYSPIALAFNLEDHQIYEILRNKHLETTNKAAAKLTSAIQELDRDRVIESLPTYAVQFISVPVVKNGVTGRKFFLYDISYKKLTEHISTMKLVKSDFQLETTNINPWTVDNSDSKNQNPMKLASAYLSSLNQSLSIKKRLFSQKENIASNKNRNKVKDIIKILELANTARDKCRKEKPESPISRGDYLTELNTLLREMSSTDDNDTDLIAMQSFIPASGPIDWV